MLGSDFPTEAGDWPLSEPGHVAVPRQWAQRWHGFLIHSVLVSLSLSCLQDARLYFFFKNYLELLEMIYELLYQAPNSFITCFLKESSKERPVSAEL